jgi:N-acetylglucosamine-6-phosphate deacetylase
MAGSTSSVLSLSGLTPAADNTDSYCVVVSAADGSGVSITSDAATILGIADQVGSLQPGLDGDVAIFDGDPLEYTTHCTGVVIDGRVVSDDRR